MASGRPEDHSSSVLVFFVRLILFLRHLSTCMTNMVNIGKYWTFILSPTAAPTLCHGGHVFGEKCHVINFHMAGQFTPLLVLIFVFLNYYIEYEVGGLF